MCVFVVVAVVCFSTAWNKSLSPKNKNITVKKRIGESLHLQYICCLNKNNDSESGGSRDQNHHPWGLFKWPFPNLTIIGVDTCLRAKDTRKQFDQLIILLLLFFWSLNIENRIEILLLQNFPLPYITSSCLMLTDIEFGGSGRKTTKPLITDKALRKKKKLLILGYLNRCKSKPSFLNEPQNKQKTNKH